jgi:carboxyl-terminal processing protease
MKPKEFLIIFLILSRSLIHGQSIYQKDFNEFWTTIKENYAYLKEQNIDWEKVKTIYTPQAEKIKDRESFVQFLEKVLHELYNGHSSLNTNLNTSNRLVPSGQDLYVEESNGQFIITDIRKGSGAEQAGLKTGMEIIAFNGKPVKEQLIQFLPKFTSSHTPLMYQYAIDMLFAGTHDIKREITIATGKGPEVYYPDQFAINDSELLLESKVLNKNTAYIKFHNSLGNNQLIMDFDSTLDKFIHYKKLVLDLTDTPGGGNTTVARSILGRLISKTLPYQKHEYDEQPFDTKRIWLEFVMPRKTQFKGKVYVLVGHWTGSMGEGIVIGFDGMKRGRTIGTRMAGLLGAISNFQLTETKIGFQFPTERLYHVNNMPRESFLPKIRTTNTEETYRRMNKIRYQNILFSITKINSIMAKYNPHTDAWENVPDSWELFYDGYNSRWVYAPPNARSIYNGNAGRWEVGGPDWQPTYNSNKGTWEVSPKDAVAKYNSYSGEWEMAGPDWVLKHNPHDNTWKYCAPS